MVTTLLIVFLYQYLTATLLHPSYLSSPLCSWSLWTSTSSVCGLGGDRGTFLHSTSLLTVPVLPGAWRGWIQKAVCHTRSSLVYPDALAPFLAGCVFLYMWFYNMSLKGSGVSYASWYDRTVKAVLPRLCTDVKLSNSYKFNSLKDKWKRK